MKKLLFVLSCLVFALVVSCSKDDARLVNVNPNGDEDLSAYQQSVKVQLNAYKVDGNETKTELGGSDLNLVYWLPNERITLFYKDLSYDDAGYSASGTSVNRWVGGESDGYYVLNYGTGVYSMNSNMYKFTSTNAAKTKDFVQFEGVLQSFTKSAWTEDTKKQVVALYPRNPKATLTAKVEVYNNSHWSGGKFYEDLSIDTVQHVLTTTLPAYQIAKENSFADSLNISVARGNIYPANETGELLKGDLYFWNVCGGLAFTVTHDDIVAVELEGQDGEDLAGTFTVEWEDGTDDNGNGVIDAGEKIPIVKTVVSGQKTVTVSAPNGTFTPGVQYYIVTIPQTFANGIIVTGLRADGKGYETKIDKANLKFNRSKFVRKKNFDEGKTATDIYTYTFAGTSPANEFPFYESSQDYTIQSYRTRISTGVSRPMAWKVQISTDDGSTYQDLTEANKGALGVDWLTFSPNGATNAGLTPETFSVMASTCPPAATSVDAEEYHAEILRNREARDFYEGASGNNAGKASAIDLSLYDANGNLIPGGRSTANCYIVKAPGWYKIPLVYGNAIKNGAINKSAYTRTSYPEYLDGSGSTEKMISLEKFVVPTYYSDYGDRVDFLDPTGTSTDISNAWVSKRSHFINRVSILWQDREDLVKDIAILKEDGVTSSWSKDEKFAYFRIPKASIKQGNAVIAAYAYTGDDPTNTFIVWSWHIWITDQDFTPIDVTNETGVDYKFMPVNLGWSAVGDRIDYEGREAKVRIVQVGNESANIEFTIVQNGKEGIEPTGNNPFFQWGRKDPQLASTGFDNAPHEYWGEIGNWSGAPTGVHNDGTFKVDNAMYGPGAEYDLGNFQSQKRISIYAQNPSTFNITKDPYEGITSMEGRYSNLWSMESYRLGDGASPLIADDNVVVKTIYDPSPYGFTVPVSGAFTGFTTETAANATTVGQGGEYTQFANGEEKGFYFWTSPAKTNTIFFPLTGIRRQSDGTWAGLGEEGYYWTANSSYTRSGYSFQFGCKNSTQLVSDDNYDDGTPYVLLRTNYKGTGYSIRPAVDKSL